MDNRFRELTERLVVPGNPHSMFTASEFHELHDYIIELDKKKNDPKLKIKKIPKEKRG
jgi:hypothetical protein